MSELADKISQFSRDRLALLCTELQKRLDKVESQWREPVAIIGMSCRFPGAKDVESFWDLLRNGVDAISEIPSDRWDVDAFFDPDPNIPGKMYSRDGGFLRDIDGFDPAFFNISPREAVSLDPQYRLLLEVTWEALEDAGQNPRELRGSRTGVFVGVGTDDYAKIQIRSSDPEAITTYTGTGNAHCYGVGRISYFLGLQGPNFPVDTACSSSLVVTHLACQSLRLGECNLAVAGGVHLMLSPVGTIFLSKARALAPDGRCKAFDARADGFARGEGCGIIVLKRLSDAQANGDRILAVIRGSAVNHDGPSSGFTVPNGPAQQLVVQAALRAAQLQPTDIGYVEAHGTGTSLGDPIELRSLAAVVGREAGRPADSPVVVGSVKTNLGHLEAGAGVAGVIKTVLALEHEEIPPHLHFKKINPHISLDAGPFVIPTQPLPWHRSERPRMAGVSSFGLSGTNAHLIVAEAPPSKQLAENVDRPFHVLTLSARTETALRALAGRFERHLSKTPSQSIADVCFTANTGRAQFAHRLAIVCGDNDSLQQELKTFSRGVKSPAIATGRVASDKRPKVAFLFSGEDSPYRGMGRQLYASEPTFRKAIQQCEDVLAGSLERPLVKFFCTEATEDSILCQPVCAQAALAALQYALAQLWLSWGVEPSAVLGYGLGEYAAAVTAGALRFEDALKLVVERARLVQSLASTGKTALVVAEKELLAQAARGITAELALVAMNSAQAMVVSGPAPQLGEFLKQCKKDGIKARLLPGMAVLYSPAAHPILGPLAETAAAISFRNAQIPMVSSATGNWVNSEIDWGQHWPWHTCHPVRFSDAMETLHKSGADCFLEIGPKPTLLRWGRECLPKDGLAWQASLQPKDDCRQILSSVAGLYTRGTSVAWAALDGRRERRRVSLPTYPFEHQRYWLEPGRAVQSPALLVEEDALKEPAMRATIERLVHCFGEDGAQAFNRRVTAPLVFLSSTGASLFYLNRSSSVILIQAFVGPPESFDIAARELFEYARSQGLDLVFFALEVWAERLRKFGLTTTSVGVWQTVPDLGSFDLQDPKFRRLRSKSNSYRNRGSCSTDEYRIGSDPSTDRRFVELMEAWVARKKKKSPFVALLKEEALSARLDSKYRIFLTRRQDAIESAVILTPIESKNGYLLDLEFYDAQMPSGCLEFSIVSTIEQLKKEGISYYSLGSTLGTQLAPDAHEDKRVRDILESLHKKGILNDDGIFVFKKKFHPVTQRLSICCLPDTDVAVLSDVLLMLAAPERMTDEAERALSAAPKPQQRWLAPGSSRRPLSMAGHEPAAAAFHPLLVRRMPLALSDVVFECLVGFGSGESSWLADHQVLGSLVIPAAAYIEMAVAAAMEIFPGAHCVLEEISFVEPLTLRKEEARMVQLVFSYGAAGRCSFRVCSTRQEAGLNTSDWSVHATGTVHRTAGQSPWPVASIVSPEEIQVRGLKMEDVESYYLQVEQFGLKYGPSFRAIRELWCGFGEAFARIVLPGQLRSDAGSYQMHPALLDGCLQVQGAALLASRGESTARGIYLPVHVERVISTGWAATALQVHCRLRPVEGANTEQIVGDIQVCDTSGNLLTSIEGFAVKRTSGEVLDLLLKRGPAKVFHQIEWRLQPRERTAKLKVADGPGKWVLFADSAGIADRLGKQLQECGEESVMVWPSNTLEPSDSQGWHVNPTAPEHFRQLFENIGPLRRVVYLWSAEPIGPGPLNLASVKQAQVLGCEGLLHLVQALATSATTRSRSLWLVTQGTQAVGSARGLSNPAQASIWGFGRTLAQEHPEIWGGMIDLEFPASAPQEKALLAEIFDPQDEDHLAFRGEQRNVARLVGKEIWRSSSPLRFRDDATYVITGGLGGLGLTIARWMVAAGVRHLVLVGRTNAPAEAGNALAELEAAGAQRAIYHQADVSQEAEVMRLLNYIEHSLPPLRGIFHAAGLVADGTLLQQSWSQFLQVMAAKVDGAWHLHNLTSGLALDHFVLFSSSAAILGAAGQGNYAAANAFMDALAHFRQAQDLPALSINWGPWAEVGMSAALSARGAAQRAGHGLRSILPAEGVRLLDQAMCESWAQVGIVSVEWEKLLKTAAPLLRRSSLFKDLAGAVADVGIKLDQEPSPIIKECLDAAPEERRRLLEGYAVERVAEILGSQPANVTLDEPLTSQGFDSLMALELRERVEAELRISIPIVVFFQSNNLRELIEFMLEELAKSFPGIAAPGVDLESPDEVLAKLDQLSDAEVDATLRRILAEEQ